MPVEMVAGSVRKSRVMSPEVKASLAKLSSAELIEVMGHIRESDGDNQNQNQNSGAALQAMSKEELLKQAEALPVEVLRNVMASSGIIK